MTLSRLDLILGSVIIILIMVLVFTHIKAGSQNNSSPAEDAEIHVVVEKVKSELKKVDDRRLDRGEAPLFQIADFTLEINFVAKTVKKANGELRTELFAVGGETEISAEKVQKITLNFKAVPDETSVSPDPLPHKPEGFKNMPQKKGAERQ